MDEPNNPPDTAGQLRPTPELPTSVVSLWIPVTVGTVLWLVAFVVLLVAGVHGLWLWTTLAGGGLGLVGMGIMVWQRAASRRGSRFAQRNL